MVAYCTADDLMVDRNFPFPAGLSKDTYVQQAALEIDARIGRLYKTPVVFDTAMDREKYRPTLNLLSWLNAALATGRIIMAMAMTSEDSQVHAYAKNLVDQATSLLEEIVGNQIVLEGAPSSSSVNGEEAYRAPHGGIAQVDSSSAVENFYDSVFTPSTPWGYSLVSTNLFRP